MNKPFRLSILGVLFWVGVIVLSAQESGVKPASPSNPPLSFGLLVDNSGSVRSVIREVINVGKGVVERSQPGDRIFLVRFVSSDQIKILQDFSSQKSVFVEALDGIYVEGGLSAITDALYMAAEHLSKDGEKEGSEGHKRALILITDGADERSYYRRERLMALLREKKVRVYAVGFPQALERQGVRVQERARKYLTTLASESGGRAYFPVSEAEIEIVANSVLNDIRAQ